MKWKEAKEVCISLKAGSLKIALLVKTMPIVAAMLEEPISVAFLGE